VAETQRVEAVPVIVLKVNVAARVYAPVVCGVNRSGFVVVECKDEFEIASCVGHVIAAVDPAAIFEVDPDTRTYVASPPVIDTPPT
jgi:hypothetical protein